MSLGADDVRHRPWVHQGISRNVFRHAVSEIEMVETVLDQERAFEIILDHERAFEVSR